MVAQTAIDGIWAVLLPVVVGGALTLGGVVLGPALTHWLSQRSGNRALRQEKFRELLEALHEHGEWLDTVKNVKVYGEERGISPDPFPKALVICALHFPEFLPMVRKLEKPVAAYALWMAEAANKRLHGKFDTINEGFADVYTQYLTTFSQVRDSIIAEAIAKRGEI
ncbi:MULTISPECIES: hypothetical protein [unclassified Mesorhizobium]|uniref:hypothetical protein n=1 Tax=unclassified Mesorhizobium TaxID=325217 RepID=UPI001128D176|nr:MULTISPECIES: hypothetical protein [unclassified Mesorhizobium]TPK42297.1 hypothetical protein FJ550_30135 [Mesorhizobium sp. B2-5-2]TPL44508.1 hypothetical protein FJ961_04005 [Mesorhizobium sp. B2-4-5]TPM68695.1 hypothetical protein FJ968_29810 [Mesorhizobium sp. B2-1-6]TPN71745.1 hypothetical protein FJ985_30640 [Mesorhizobium sp. B1-1-2]